MVDVAMPETRTAEATAPEITPYYIAAAQNGVAHNPRVLKQGECFAVLDDFGDVQALGPGPEGVFFEDTRYVSQLVTTLDGLRPLLLSSTVSEDNSTFLADLANPDLYDGARLRLGRDTVHILSKTRLGPTALFRTLELRNYGNGTAHFTLELVFGADFVDMFEVRGIVRARRGVTQLDDHDADGPTLSYRSLDDCLCRARFCFQPHPVLTNPRRARWDIELPAGGQQKIDIAIHFDRDDKRRIVRASNGTGADKPPQPRHPGWAEVTTDNPEFDDWLDRSRADLAMLTTETPHGLYAYAGIPWFSTAFGRDGIITALETLWLAPDLAAGTLRYLAANQATTLDPASDAEPGKILHETRHGEMARCGEVPFARYYGSVDSTPLFVVLAAAYYRRTGDLELIETLWSNIEAALVWIGEYGDLDDDGFLEYDRKSVNGLINQGWKDSGDSIFHADGSLAEAPIALPEVQAYVYGAYQGASELAAALGNVLRSETYAAAAATLRRRFDEAFWLDELGTYALALDRDKKPCRIRASNAGHVLYTGLALPERAETVARTLMDAASFSGWGIRTVAEGEMRYNPMSYHNGSVWPHDNALTALGFARYGLIEPLHRLTSGLFAAASFMDGKRMPELFCGFSPRAGTGPTSYPVACNPQAWAAACVFALLDANLGIEFDGPTHILKIARPSLPDWLDEVTIRNLHVGAAVSDLLIRRGPAGVSVEVLRQQGPNKTLVTT